MARTRTGIMTIPIPNESMAELVEKSAESGAKPTLPTYKTIAEVLEKKNGSGVKLVFWTFARTVMIAPPMMLVGVPWRQALAGAALSSVGISLFAMLRIYSAEYELSRRYFKDRRWMQQKTNAPRGLKRIA